MAIPGNFLSETTSSIDPNTSGWKAKLNATISLGTGGRVGDGVLTVKSVAAGEMQAVTVSTYTVIPGETCFAFADASSASVPERIGIRWLNSSNAEISVTWSLTTATASSSWHRVSVAGTAPAGAVRAAVILSSTPAAGLVSHYWENVYFGLPVRTQGNLFGFNTESGGELDATSWTAELNAGISRQAPMVSWPAAWYYTGGQVMAITASAAGDTAARTTERAVATEGTEYRARLYMNPPTAASNTWVELRFFDSGGVQLSATRAYLAAPGTSWYGQYVSAVAPAGTAELEVAAGVDSATSGQVLRVEGVVVTIAPQLKADSVVPYADASFEQGVAGWTVTSGVATIARSTPFAAQGYDGGYSLTVTSATATASTLRSAAFPIPAGTDGLPWRLQVATRITAGGWSMSFGLRWYGAGGVDLGLTSQSTGLSTTDWVTWILSVDAPAGAVEVAVELTPTATATSSVLRLDSVAVWQAAALIEVDAHDDTASLTLTLRELEVGELIWVWRVAPGGIRTLVRGPGGLYDGVPIVSDMLVIEDYEAPTGTLMYYYVESRAETEVIPERRTSDTHTLDPGDPDEAWLKDPGAPHRNLRVLVKEPPAWKRPAVQAAYKVRGRRRVVIHSDVRSGLEGDLVVYTRSDDEAAALHWILDGGSTLLWQPAPDLHEQDLYVSVGEAGLPRAAPVAGEAWREWTLPLTQVDMPVTAGVGGSAGRTWQDVLAEFATWQAVLDAYATWEDVLFDRKIGG